MYPHERSLVLKFKNDPFAIVGVNSDADKEKLRPEIEKNGITWRSFWNGEKGTKGPIAAAWNVKGWPTLYVIDPQGIIRYKGVGANLPEVTAAIEKALAGAKK